MEQSPVVLRGVDKENNPGCQGNIKHLRALSPVLQPLVSPPANPPTPICSHHSQLVHGLLAGNWRDSRASGTPNQPLPESQIHRVLPRKRLPQRLPQSGKTSWAAREGTLE